MITGIIGAMQVETDALKAMVKKPTKETVGGVEFVRGTIGKHEVVVAQCGIGKVFAALCAEAMILRYGVGRIINTGVAGTLCDRLGLLNIAVSTAVVQHDMDTSPLGDPIGLISGINIVQIPADKELGELVCRAAQALGTPCLSGVIASGDQFIADPQKKQFICQAFDAIACEMEGAAIGQVCYVNNVPFVVVRCISDNADDRAGSMDYPQLCRAAAEQSQRLIEEILS